MKHLSLSLSGVIAAAAIALSGCESSPNTTRGAGIGAATGAVIGGIIGHQSGETGAGAALGAAVGGVAGGAYGNSKDNADYRRNAGYSSDHEFYMAQMNPDEIATLRARAASSGRSSYQLTDFLTAEEKENLRRRAAGRRPIGS